MPTTKKMPVVLQKTQEFQYLYRLIYTIKFFDNVGRKKVYGIEIRYGDIIEKIEDISSVKKIVITLLQKLEAEKCSPLHLKDVVDDFVIDQII